MDELAPAGPGERLRLGLNLPTWPRRDGSHATWSELRALARDVEAAGFDTLWAPDHLLREVDGRPPIGFHECWTIVTAAAEATSTIGIGPFVLATAFRNPGLVAKMATTLDEVSGGRLILGLGAGDPAHDRSWEAFGYDAPRAGSRHAEAVEVIARLLRAAGDAAVPDPVSFAGEFHRLERARIVPPGPRPEGPPIWCAGKGSRTLGTAARWADAVNVNVPLASADDARAIVAHASAACAEVGRDPVTLKVTGWARLSLSDDGRAEVRPGGWLSGTAEEVRATLGGIRAAGVTHLTLYAGEAGDPSPLPALTRPVLEGLVRILGPALG